MLKKVFVNNKEVPVPVPIRTLAEAVDWVEKTLVQRNAIITKVALEGREVTNLTEKQRGAISLVGQSLEFKIDSPRELAIQTFDAIRELAYEMVKRFKPLAVKCWGLESDTHLAELTEIVDDMKLMLDLINHVNGMLDYTHADMAPVNGLAGLIMRAHKDLDQARRTCEWRKCARVLLNRLEYYMKELVVETENLQINIISTGTDG